jgi:SAM-dependent methyltransferase
MQLRRCCRRHERGARGSDCGTNVLFRRGDAEHVPFEEAHFDGVVTRLAMHHFANPQRALHEMFRVLRPGGIAVIVDVVSSEEEEDSNLQNAIERLRDPSHVRMLRARKLDACVARAGFCDLVPITWDKIREFEEWMGILNDPARAEPLRTVVRALAEAGRTAGMGLSVANDRIVFLHRRRLVKATKPVTHSALSAAAACTDEPTWTLGGNGEQAAEALTGSNWKVCTQRV